MQNYRDILLNKFTQEYERLNPQQQKAVDTIEGPVMVIAGPGTGKTQILAARIGKILLETDALPENILCLTYTDAGTIAMRKRLVQFIGADAYKVNIYTFHAFCNDVIQDNLSLFEKNSLDAISELESIELFKTLIDNFPKNHPLKRYRGDVYFEVKNLKNLFSSMKREGWTPEYINQKIDEYINELPARDEYIAKRAVKEFKKGDVRTDKIEEEKEKMEKLRAAVNEFENYQTLMRKRNRYDFDDMINWVIRVFEENKIVLANYQEKFQYILVDEYQDTSGTQNKLVQLLINYWEKPNVFVVGDDDQSIYRFQGANVENMLEFANAYIKDLITVVLTSNYRSTQPILDVSKTVINRNQERLINKIDGLTKDLLAANTKINGLKHLPVIAEYNSVKDEMASTTFKVEALLDQQVVPGKIAIIYKENKYGEELAKYFRLKNLPVYSKRNINILENPFIKKIINLLRYLNAEHDIPYGGDEMLFEILHYDFYNIPPIEIAKITVETNQKKYNGELTSIRKLLNDKANKPPTDLFDTGMNVGLKNISSMLEKLIGDVSNVTLQQLFENVVQHAAVLPYIMKSNNKIELMQLLTALFNFIKEETSRNAALDLKELINIIDLMEKEGLSLPLVQVAGNDKGVNLLTAHGSKGLEFDHVFFVGCNATSWEKKRKPGGGYKFPDTMFSSQPNSSDEEELRRLFYVALTRAETNLYISYAKYKNDGKEMEPSMFIAEILEQHPLPIEKIALSPEQLMDFDLLHFTAQAPEIEKAEEDFISGILDKFVMNVTALNSYLKCPLGFYYQNLIRIPAGKNEATVFGSAIHHALECLFRKMQDGKKDTFPPATEVIADFNWYMKRHRENFTKEAFERRVEYGDEVLKNYYDKYINTWNKVVAVERNIRGVVVNGVPIKGKLDKLEFDGKNVNVVDYKSGDIDKAIPKLKPPHDKDPNGGDYWRQAVFYKILVDNYGQKDWKVISTEFDFVEPDKKKEYRKEKIVINPEDIETVKQQLTAVWDKIQNRDFYTGCGKEDCHWCNFVKDNNMAVALHELNEEEPEDA
ncbi:ATP-dependent helicase [Ferruginibacter lapsinanis]|uniref:ATP-dependent helicase n=1 Tax=Ferruginibacter lapsinanis TaxID=563172 RepID=UPI001E53EFCC|nr:ATP-dependent DNA helicase [Ferruginibacter lapsinanis]UEG50606.1 ATP-dependent helicase [Ferruginibacter lapsinanis]